MFVINVVPIDLSVSVISQDVFGEFGKVFLGNEGEIVEEASVFENRIQVDDFLFHEGIDLLLFGGRLLGHYLTELKIDLLKIFVSFILLQIINSQISLNFNF